MALLPPTIHPVFVHFPAALIPTAAVFATLAAYGRGRVREWAAPATLLLLALALAGTVLAVASGVWEEQRVKDDLDADTHFLVEVHEVLGFVALAATAGLTAWLAWKRRTLWDSRARHAFVALAWIAVLVVVLGAGLGGRLVFELGVGTPQGDGA